jgi:hypothetical protein
VAEVPPFGLLQLQIQGPDPVTVVAMPVPQRFVVGAVVNVWFTAIPQVAFVYGLGVVIVNVVLPDILPKEAVIIEVPKATPVAKPLSLEIAADAAGNIRDEILFCAN